MNADREADGRDREHESLERDCGQSPSRSRCERPIAPEQFNALRRLKLLRLVRRTQPRSKLSVALAQGTGPEGFKPFARIFLDTPHAFVV